MGRGNFEGKGRPNVKYRDSLRSSVKKRLNRSRCRLGCGLRWAVGIMCYMRDAAMATSFGTQFAITGFGCMIASDTLFDSRGGFAGLSYPMKTQPRSSV